MMAKSIYYLLISLIRSIFFIMNRSIHFLILHMRSNHFQRLAILLVVVFFWGVAYIFSGSSAVHFFSGTTGIAHVSWSFETNIGNAGSLSFDYDPTPAYNKANLVGTDITGFFWSQTTGWAEFTGSTQITLRNNLTGVREVWDASGFAWSDAAGWMTLSGTEYYPDTATLSGWLWSDTLGWTSLNTIAANVGLGFVGRVAVLWTVAGNNIYSLNIQNYQAGAKFEISNISNVLNDVRKKLSLTLRNVWINNLNTVAPIGATTPNILNQSIYYTHTGSSEFIVAYSYLESSLNTPTSPRSLVVIGGDIFIDTGITFPDNTPPHAIVAMKNDAWKWGNIYIRGDVTKIHSSLIAEGSLYSARRLAGAWVFYNADHTSITSLPNYQLYVKWSIVSHNTIGWAWLSSAPKCPYTESACTYEQSLRYDMNYFRDFQTWAIVAPDTVANHRGYPVTEYNDKSIVIEYDGRITSDPPPLL